MQLLREYIETITPLTSDQWLDIRSCAKSIVLQKGEVLVYKGARFNKEVFVEQGVMRAFITDNDFNEKGTAFFRSKEFMGTNMLRTQQGLSNHTYQALTHTNLILFDAKKLYQILTSSPRLRDFAKAVKENENARLARRDECLLQVKGKDKYLKFRSCYPDIENEIANHHIASYLGLTPVSLSRIRKDLELIPAINN